MKVGRNGRSKLITITVTQLELKKLMALLSTTRVTGTGNTECTWCGGEGSCSPRCIDLCAWALLKGLLKT